MDSEVLESIVEANDAMTLEGYLPNQGVKMRLTDENDTQLFFGDVHPNV
jgi:hypothetical protein